MSGSGNFTEETVSLKQGALIFDGDDTLWPIQSFYDQAKAEFYDLMELQGFPRDLARSTYTECDRENIKTYGLSRRRFPQSMKDAYLALTSDSSSPPRPAILEQVDAIGNSVFDRTPVLMPHAMYVLSQLQRSYHLILYSVGDFEVQWGKVRALGLEPLFGAIYITEKKNHEQLQLILDEQDLAPSATWMVGNSIRSDINPALRLGLRCIWVQTNTWAHENEELLPGQVWRVSDLSEIPGIVAHADIASEL